MIEFKKPLSIDIMRKGVFIKTLRTPNAERFIFGYDKNGEPIYDMERIKEFVETKMPTIKKHELSNFIVRFSCFYLEYTKQSCNFAIVKNNSSNHGENRDTQQRNR